MLEVFRFCPRCGKPLVDRVRRSGNTRRACPDAACGFVQRRNPTPAVGALVELDGEIILARNAGWPPEWYALISGYLEAGEDPRKAVAREVKEELNLDTVSATVIGNYPFVEKNEVMLCYHVIARGEVRLGAELVDYRRYQPHELQPWPRATGLAVADWMAARGLPFEFRDFPGAEAMLRRVHRGEV